MTEAILRIPILDCIPDGYVLRTQQVQALLFIEKNYDNYRFFCLNLPVGAGKSVIAITYNNWIARNNLGKCADITPTRILQDQYAADFNWIPVLKGMSSYICDKTANCNSCTEYKRHSMEGKLCGGPSECTYMAARTDALNSPIAIFNFHSFLFTKMYENKKHLVIDEGHNTRSFLEELYSVNLWCCELGFEKEYPSNKESVLALLEATYGKINLELNEAIARKLDNIEELEEMQKKIASVSDAIKSFGSHILIVKKEEVYKKKRWLRRNMSEFTNTIQTVFRIKPLNVSKIAHELMWNNAEKVLFLSATIGKTDMEDLGIKEDEVAHFVSDSPIPADRRKFIAYPVASMNYKNQKESLPKIIDAIKKIADKNSNTKGLIHCTYEISRQLEKELINPRFLFHNNTNKNYIFDKFKEAKTPVILMGCGMSEGINLPDDYARWQIILKVQYPSLQDDVWSWKCHNNSKAYTWETIKTIIQQSGRICRGPTDKGFTYMLDEEFEKIWKRGNKWGMWPDWFTEAYVKVEINKDK